MSGELLFLLMNKTVTYSDSKQEGITLYLLQKSSQDLLVLISYKSNQSYITL